MGDETLTAAAVPLELADSRPAELLHRGAVEAAEAAVVDR